MKNKFWIGIFIIVVFAFGVGVGAWIPRSAKTRELHFEHDPQSGSVTAYTYYRGADGTEIRDGDYFEFAGSAKVRARYRDGLIVSGGGTLN